MSHLAPAIHDQSVEFPAILRLHALNATGDLAAKVRITDVVYITREIAYLASLLAGNEK